MWRLLALLAAPQLPLALLLLLLAWPELGAGQLSVPVTNTTQFAAALGQPVCDGDHPGPLRRGGEGLALRHGCSQNPCCMQPLWTSKKTGIYGRPLDGLHGRGKRCSKE